MALKIGNVTLKNNLILAPMAGVTNSVFRAICHEMGAGLVVSEMISDKGLLFDNRRTKDILTVNQSERPLSVQIFGSDLETMVKAAIYIDKHVECDIIDINMGCPVPKIALKNQAGAALMKNPELIKNIIKEIVKNVQKPVSVKIRSGWDTDSINACLVAKKIEEAGAAMITIHARTRAQGYSGKADLEIIKKVKGCVNIPVIGNGDVCDGITAQKMLNETNCDGIMIGRAALGNPWIFREITHYLQTGEILKRPSSDEIRTMILRHLYCLCQLKPEKIAILEMRGQAAWYLKGLKKAAQVRTLISKANTKIELETIINEYFSTLNG